MDHPSQIRRLLGCGVLAAWTIASCQDSTTPAPHDTPASLTVPDSVSVLEGDSLALHATLTDSLGDTLHGFAVVWASADTTVVTVDSTGMVHFRGPGLTTVSALSAGLTAHTTVNAAVQFTAVAAGSVYGGYPAPWCGVTTRGSVWCIEGVTGHPLISIPEPAGGVTQFTLGTNHGCGLSPDHSAYCWGVNTYGQLGGDTALGTTTVVRAPVTVSGGLHSQLLTAGVFHTCGLTAAGAAYCWGHNSHGQLGNGDTTGTAQSTPSLVTGGLTFQSLAAGDRHTCGLTPGGSIYCWGTNDGSALGTADSTLGLSFSPVAVASAAHFVQVVAGADYSCGLGDDGTAYCWGSDLFNQLGVDTTTECSPVFYSCSKLPQIVSGGIKFKSLAAHAGLGNHLNGLTCGLTSGGSAYCWGRNQFGEVGDGTMATRASPTAVGGGLTFASLSVGDYQSCGTTTAGTVYCWGFNFNLTPSPIPEQP